MQLRRADEVLIVEIRPDNHRLGLVVGGHLRADVLLENFVQFDAKSFARVEFCLCVEKIVEEMEEESGRAGEGWLLQRLG